VDVLSIAVLLDVRLTEFHCKIHPLYDLVISSIYHYALHPVCRTLYYYLPSFLIVYLGLISVATARDDLEHPFKFNKKLDRHPAWASVFEAPLLYIL
jgi:hypothetical protein